jgi:DNA topoisomerase-1
LALRSDNEKGDGTADTVGCCSLRIEHVKLHNTYDGKDFMEELNFLGKDWIPYHNIVSVEPEVFTNLQWFMACCCR